MKRLREERDRFDTELDLVHNCLTDVYNMADQGRVREILDRIRQTLDAKESLAK